MAQQIVLVLTFIAAIGCGVVAGIFFAFSSFVMAALGRIPAAHGIAVMQSINITAINPGFMLALFGTALLCLALAATAFFPWHQPGSAMIVAAGLLYLLGCIGVTMIRNVPLNDLLAAAQPDTPEAHALWSRYLREWTRWNHVRTMAPAASAVLFTLALLSRYGARIAAGG
jgi:uncharacterized membrane protein